MLPTALHLCEGGLVRGVTTGDHLLEMPILGLDDLIGGLTLVLVVAWPTELLACHRFHQLTAFFTSFATFGVGLIGTLPSTNRRATS